MPGALRERVDLAVQRLAQGARHDASRLERTRDLAELPVEFDRSREEVVEPSCRTLPMRVENERVDLLAQVGDVCAEGEDVLDRAVVQIEADTHQPLLAGRDEDVLPLGGALEQQLALEDRGEGRRSDREEGVGTRDGLRDAGDDDGTGRGKAPDERRAEGAASEQGQAAATESRPRRRARSAALRAVPDRDHWLDRLLDLPERCLARHAEQHEEAQLDLAGGGGRQLDEKRARAGHAVEVVRRRLDGLAARLSERLDGNLRVRGVELSFRGEPDHDVGGVHARRDAVGRIVRTAACERDLRGAVGGLEEPVDAWLGVDEQRAVRSLEPGRAPGGGQDELRAPVGSLRVVPATRKGRHGSALDRAAMRSSPGWFHVFVHDPSLFATGHPGTMPQSGWLTRLPGEGALDGGHDAVGLVPLLVDAHTDRGALLRAVADENDRCLGPRAHG